MTFDIVENNEKIYKILFSDTRLKILKNLKKRKMTISELVVVTGIQRNAVYKHIDKLINIGFVNKIEDSNHKWVYYELTESGRRILDTGKYQITILLSFTLLSGIFGLLLLIKSIIFYVKPPGIKGFSLSEFDIGIIFLVLFALFLIVTILRYYFKNKVLKNKLAV